MCWTVVALRKESVDRNFFVERDRKLILMSLSARRAWIEILLVYLALIRYLVALRKESVDRNSTVSANLTVSTTSLSARRAWIEIIDDLEPSSTRKCRSPQGERG